MANPKIIDYPENRELLRKEFEKMAAGPKFQSSVRDAKAFLAGDVVAEEKKEAMSLGKAEVLVETWCDNHPVASEAYAVYSKAFDEATKQRTAFNTGKVLMEQGMVAQALPYLREAAHDYFGLYSEAEELLQDCEFQLGDDQT